MKIALIAPVFYTIPASKYGGVESVVYNLAEGLGKKGHEVHVFASGDSPENPNYKIIPISEKATANIPEIAEDPKKREVHNHMAIAEALIKLKDNDYDIVHNHNDWKFMSFAGLLNRPLITTHHNSLHYPFKKMVFEHHKSLPHISISFSQRKLLPDLNWYGNVYNSVKIEEYPYNDTPGDRMVFLARMSKNKGPIDAAMAAAQAKKPIDILTRIDIGSEEEYFEKFKKTLDEKYVKYFGEIDHESKIRYLQNARCLLAPINWEEPFGLYFIEAMSCGTPVIAFSRGSVPEVIEDGVSGFIVNHDASDKRGDWITKKTGIDGLCEAINNIYSMPQEKYDQMRKASRAQVEKLFTVERMADQYELIFNRIISDKTLL